jgi:hypothetical protein
MTELDPIALWGAVLSTALVITKFIEMWSARSRIEVSYSFASDPAVGNEVIIRNLSGTPIIITYWELLWLEKKWFRWKTHNGEFPDNGGEDIKIGGHSSTKLVFRDQYHFSWNEKSLGSSKIYLKLHIAGKSKPVMEKVYPD